MVDPLLQITGLHIEFSVDKKWIPAVRGIDLTLGQGEVLALVGESGSGKSTLAMAVPGLLADNARVAGSIRLGGVELVNADEKTLTEVRGDDVGVVFQEPMTAFNPVYTVGWQIVEAIRMHRDVTAAQARARAVELGATTRQLQWFFLGPQSLGMYDSSGYESKVVLQLYLRSRI